MMTIIIGVVIIILLIISLIPNYQAMKLAKNQGQKPTRYTIMVGIDLILIVLIAITLILKMNS
ncbi:membrane protein [Staphylococcus sp. TE8]|nr:membrane protein [Staphylococcus sp. TE8]